MLTLDWSTAGFQTFKDFRVDLKKKVPNYYYEIN